MNRRKGLAFVIAILLFTSKNSSYGYGANTMIDEIGNVELETITLISEDAMSPRWSPDGEKLLFTKLIPGKPEVWISDANGKNQNKIGEGGLPCWSPDASRCAYLSLAKGLAAMGEYPTNLVISDINGTIIYKDSEEMTCQLFATFDVEKMFWIEERIVWIGSVSGGYYEGSRRIKIFDMDNLKWEYTSDTKYPLAKQLLRQYIRAANVYVNSVPPFLPASKYFKKISENIILQKYAGIWISNASNDFSKCLIHYGSYLELNPNNNILAYTHFKRGTGGLVGSVYVATINASSQSPKTYWNIDVGIDSGVYEGDELLIERAKYNPITKRLLGGDGNVLAIARVIKAETNAAVVVSSAIIHDIEIGCIVAKNELFGAITGKAESSSEYEYEEPIKKPYSQQTPASNLSAKDDVEAKDVDKHIASEEVSATLTVLKGVSVNIRHARESQGFNQHKKVIENINMCLKDLISIRDYPSYRVNEKLQNLVEESISSLNDVVRTYRGRFQDYVLIRAIEKSINNYISANR